MALWTKEMWGGFCDGKLDIRDMDDKFGGPNERKVPALFTNQKLAREQYEDVRRVGIVEIPKKRRS